MKTRLQSWASPTTHFGNETAGRLSPAGLVGSGRAGRPCQKPGLTSSAPPIQAQAQHFGLVHHDAHSVWELLVKEPVLQNQVPKVSIALDSSRISYPRGVS